MPPGLTSEERARRKAAPEGAPEASRRQSTNAIETNGLGKRCGRTWALRECTARGPCRAPGRALVGPNGAGKTTLMNMTAGLAVPTVGTVAVLGGQPAGSQAALDGIAFVAQDAPVYKNLSVADMLHLTRNLEPALRPGGRRGPGWPSSASR